MEKKRFCFFELHVRNQDVQSLKDNCRATTVTEGVVRWRAKRGTLKAACDGEVRTDV